MPINVRAAYARSVSGGLRCVGRDPKGRRMVYTGSNNAEVQLVRRRAECASSSHSGDRSEGLDDGCGDNPQTSICSAHFFLNAGCLQRLVVGANFPDNFRRGGWLTCLHDEPTCAFPSSA